MRPMWKAGEGVSWESFYFLDEKGREASPDNPHNIKLQPPLCPKLSIFLLDFIFSSYHSGLLDTWCIYLFTVCLLPQRCTQEGRDFVSLVHNYIQCLQRCLANCDHLTYVYCMNECSCLWVSFSFLLWTRSWWLRLWQPPWGQETRESQKNWLWHCWATKPKLAAPSSGPFVQ